MNIIRLCGGLGNQLFQYAFGKAQKQCGITVLYDSSWYNKIRNPLRPLLLDKFKINLEMANSTQYFRIITEKGFESKKIFDVGFKYTGYWQSPLYHYEIYSELQKEIQLKEEYYTSEYSELKKIIIKSNSVSVHVRRGDYLNKENHHVLPLEYYKKALKLIQSLKGDCKVFVFSDDIFWCKKQFSDVYFVQLNDYLEFELMRFCTHNIIANSTFSWWAAYLNENTNKTVIAPKRWVVKAEDQNNIDKKGLILNDWIKL
jgi:hypothetical protein